MRNKEALILLAMFGIGGLILWLKKKSTQITLGSGGIYTNYPTSQDTLNNVGNIRASGDSFQGEISSSSGSFKSFSSPIYGTRAVMKILKTYIESYNLNTIEKIISRYAPASENNTQSYINFVSSQTGIRKDAPISWNQSTISDITKAIVKMENGITLPDEILLRAYEMV